MQPFAEPVISQSSIEGVDSLFVPAQKEPYAQILREKYEELQFGFDNNIRTLEISRLGNSQQLLPQVQPGVRAGLDGGVVFNVQLKQVLFDGGVYQAQHKSDDHNAVLRQIELLTDLNSRASNDIKTFISHKKNLQTFELLNKLSNYFAELLRLAETRVNGGIGAASEVSLFQLKLSEIQTDARIALADAEADLAALGSDISDVPAPDFIFTEGRLPLSIIKAIAQRELKVSELALARTQTIPKVVLEARGGVDPIRGAPSTDLGLSIDSKPIAIGGNVGVKFAEQELALASHNLGMAAREAERQTKRLRARIQALEDQLSQTEALSLQAKSRFHSFSDQFRAGTSNLTEAAGLLETLRQSLETKVDLRYRILDLQRQLAEQGGHFWTFGATQS